MRCPTCQGPTRVAETRVAGSKAVRRLRVCLASTCGFRAWTVELFVGRLFDFKIRVGPSGLEIARTDEQP